MVEHTPRVSIAVPVFNGENYLAETLDSLLAQTYTDIEVVICDNASTDGTERVARSYVDRDPRVTYVRNPANVGPVRNFNQAFRLCRGEYFKWAPHDDLYDPRFLEECVAVLDANPDVVLCSTKTRLIDQDGVVYGEHEPKLPYDDPRPNVRFRALLQDYTCFEIFGVFRADALRRTPLLGGYGHADGILLARLGLMGRIVQVPQYLYYNRVHPEKSVKHYKTYAEYTVWLDPTKAGKILFPRWRMGLEYLKGVAAAPVGTMEKVRSALQMRVWVRLFWKSLLANIVRAAMQTWSIVIRKVRVALGDESHGQSPVL